MRGDENILVIIIVMLIMVAIAFSLVAFCGGTLVAWLLFLL
jgi:hypothetical protein